MESAESQTELLEALLKWMASFRVAAGKIIITASKIINQLVINPNLWLKLLIQSVL